MSTITFLRNIGTGRHPKSKLYFWCWTVKAFNCITKNIPHSVIMSIISYREIGLHLPTFEYLAERASSGHINQY